ncbi:unnamed protein product [Ranitomeya imitator]|uniref:Reverse transcriptase/retrotransposon-derived protein RNase H-like domain-containing protein n=1 Tax=Ranitomeya imitator TaxID=111125 RepID=A0ABN9MC41_9NEOB|nr:unnamed protein product [Ranitomeya imitator]
MDPVKVQAIYDWTQPTSLKSLQKFLGFANFYRRFIANFSSIAKPLTDLTKKGADVVNWSSAAVEAFQELKRRFSSAPVLCQPDVSLPFQVEVDASEIGAGAVLSQRSSDCSVMKPCAFFSRKFSPAERNYDVGNRELLAMKLRLRKRADTDAARVANQQEGVWLCRLAVVRAVQRMAGLSAALVAGCTVAAALLLSAVTLVGALLCVAVLFPASPSHVCVLVLGDLGRSPRMTYHALSLVRNGFTVTLAGFRETEPHRDVLNNPKIKIHQLTDFKVLRVGPRLLRYVLKVTVQAVQLFWELLKMDAPYFILLQNPPGLPAIAVTWLFCLLRRCHLIIDWHNYGYSIMSLTSGPRHPVVRVAKWFVYVYEKLFGRLSSYNFCVTNAMKEDLLQNWRIKAITLHDKPAAIFKETAVELQHLLFMKLAVDYAPFRARLQSNDAHIERSAFTEKNLTSGTVRSREGRPALLISSTSWTEDEDFSVLLSALQGPYVMFCMISTFPSDPGCDR